MQKLFPAIHPDQLASLPREKLVEMISKNNRLSLQPPSPLTPGTEEKPLPLNPDASSLESLQPMPREGTDIEHKSRTLRRITDDVNALSLSVKESSSYLGISSVMAVLRVILWLDPESQAFFTKTPDRSALASRAASPPAELQAQGTSTSSEASTASVWNEIPLINAYFTYIHPIVPLIEEISFRETYMTGRRADPRWLLLLNTVLAMGSIAASTSEEHNHEKYFERAKQYLTIDILGAAHLETVQALALLGGLYLHYIQQPNLANAIMGATLRIATTLGLHRDYSEGVGPVKSSKTEQSVEMRRRVWWCTFVLDAWMGTTLGRPSMGRISHAITAQAPQEAIVCAPCSRSFATDNVQGGSDGMLAMLDENIRFCIITTRMEDALAMSPLIPELERLQLDAAFIEWFKSSSVQNNTPRPQNSEIAGITVHKNIMRWRYLFARVILHRPVLLWYAMRKMPMKKLGQDRRGAIEMCRDVTSDLINDIASTWQAQKPCPMAGWNATWLLYQAVMVPLLSLFSDSADQEVMGKSRHLVEIALMTLADLYPWSTTARRSYEVVSRIYGASRRHSPDMAEHCTNYTDPVEATDDSTIRPTYINTSSANSYAANNLASSGLNTSNQEIFMDNMFDSLNWSTGWADQDYPFETPSLGWDYNAMNGWGGSTQLDGYFNPVFVDTSTPVGMDMTQHTVHGSMDSTNEQYTYQ